MRVLLLLVLILIVAGIGMYYLKARLSSSAKLTIPIVAHPTPPPSLLPSFLPSPSPTFDPTSPSGVVQNFYKSYKECMFNPIPEAVGGVANYCQTNNSYVSTSFTANLKAKRIVAIDPILCAQNTPNSTEVQISTPSATASRINVEVIEYFGSGLNNIQVQLIKQKGEWKVNNITCLKP